MYHVLIMQYEFAQLSAQLYKLLWTKCFSTACSLFPIQAKNVLDENYFSSIKIGGKFCANNFWHFFCI